MGRWFSIDSKFKKYPDLSPYNYTNNNPILFVDSDGNDFEILVDHINKRILIVSNIYTVDEQTYKQASKGAEQWNSKSATIDGYQVAFSVVVMSPAEGSSTMDRVQKISAITTQLNNDKIGNAFAGTIGPLSKSYDNSKVEDGESYSFVGGYTSGGKIISMNKETNYGDLGNYSDLVAHEIGHTFGLDDRDGDHNGSVDPYYGGTNGIMEYKGTNLSPISDNDVRGILNYSKDYLSNSVNLGGAKVKIIAQQGTSNGNNPLGITNNVSNSSQTETLDENLLPKE